MLKKLDDVEALLVKHGYTTKRMLDVIVATTVATTTYRNDNGANTIEIFLTFDKANDCVAVESLRTFDLQKAAHREATLACLMTASARTPLLRPSLDPVDGEIRLRVDCTCGSQGARDEDVLRAVAILPWFADAWYPQITAAMEKGRFDPNQVARVSFPKPAPRPSRKKKSPAPSRAPKPIPPSSSGHSAETPDDARVIALSRRPGGGVNRLKALFEFQQWLGAQGRAEARPEEQTDDISDDNNNVPEKKKEDNDGDNA